VLHERNRVGHALGGSNPNQAAAEDLGPAFNLLADNPAAALSGGLDPERRPPGYSPWRAMSAETAP
jgi:hypothetical protein